MSDGDLQLVLEAARWASSGGNRRLQRLVVVRDGKMTRLVRAISPGMHGHPTALVVVCTDLRLAVTYQVDVERHPTRWIDVGTMAMNMMLAAHAAGLGSCPLTSFSRPALSRLLELPPDLAPELILQLGHRAPTASRRKPSQLEVEDLVHWERYQASKLRTGGGLDS